MGVGGCVSVCRSQRHQPGPASSPTSISLSLSLSVSLSLLGWRLPPHGGAWARGQEARRTAGAEWAAKLEEAVAAREAAAMVELEAVRAQARAHAAAVTRLEDKCATLQQQQQVAGAATPAPAPEDGEADHQAVQTLLVVCPEGVEAGMALCVTGPDGREIEVAVPEGVGPGDEFELEIGGASDMDEEEEAAAAAAAAAAEEEEEEEEEEAMAEEEEEATSSAHGPAVAMSAKRVRSEGVRCSFVKRVVGPAEPHTVTGWLASCPHDWLVPVCFGSVVTETVGTGAGEDHGIDHNNNWLRFPYVFIFSRSHSLHPHPYVHRRRGRPPPAPAQPPEPGAGSCSCGGSRQQQRRRRCQRQ
eukprot:COSAG01_NODE_9465_length_2437_cov_17.224027_3_plen_358_part_00